MHFEDLRSPIESEMAVQEMHNSMKIEIHSRFYEALEEVCGTFMYEFSEFVCNADAKKPK